MSLLDAFYIIIQFARTVFSVFFAELNPGIRSENWRIRASALVTPKFLPTISHLPLVPAGVLYGVLYGAHRTSACGSMRSRDVLGSDVCGASGRIVFNYIFTPFGAPKEECL